MCNIFCCFGCLTLFGCRDRVTRKLVFFPPPPTYFIDPSLRSMYLLTEAGERVEPYSAENFVLSFIPTNHSNPSNHPRVATLLIRFPASTTTILYSHGNATDLGCLRDHLLDLSLNLQCNICCYDYEGYGLSSGRPSVSKCNRDIKAVYQWLRKNHSDDCHRIILYGQSLGSGPTVYLATQSVVSGLVIHSGLSSCMRVIEPSLVKTPWFDLFPSIDLIASVRANPHALIIHGENDADIPMIHAQMLHDNITKHTTMTHTATNTDGDADTDRGSGNSSGSGGLWLVKDAGHNDIETKYRLEYYQRLFAFIRHVEKTSDIVTISEEKESAKKKN